MTYKDVLEAARCSFTDIVYPRHCAVCDSIVPYKMKKASDRDFVWNEYVCSDCIPRLNFVQEPRCLKCGKEINSEDEEFCEDCGSSHRTFDMGFPLLNYVPPVSRAMIYMKYYGRQEYAEFYGRLIADGYGRDFVRLQIKAIVPVPVHKHREKKRGYNQAELLAKEVSKKTGIPVVNGLVIRSIDTLPQKVLNDVEREKNLHAAFVKGDAVDVPESALIVDDIYTTGATIEAVTRALRDKGVKRIYYTSVCIGKV